MGLLCLENKQWEIRRGKVNGCRLHNPILKNYYLHQVQQYSQIGGFVLRMTFISMSTIIRNKIVTQIIMSKH